MAFKQSRAIALINAALEFYQAVNRIRTHAAGLKAAVASGEIDVPYAFDSLLFYISESNTELFTDFASSISTINTEHAHFTRAVRRNALEAERQRRVRQSRNPDTRPYSDNTALYETTTIRSPIAFNPPDMNKRGDLTHAPVRPRSTPEQVAIALAEVNRLRDSETGASNHTFDHQTPSLTPRIIYTDEDLPPSNPDDEEPPPPGTKW